MAFDTKHPASVAAISGESQARASALNKDESKTPGFDVFDEFFCCRIIGRYIVEVFSPSNVKFDNVIDRHMESAISSAKFRFKRCDGKA